MKLYPLYDRPYFGESGAATDSLDERIYTLWDELADFPACRSEEALVHLMERLSALLAADNMFWVGSVRLGQGAVARNDGQRGWRAMVARHWRPTPEILEVTKQLTVDQDTEPSLTSQALAQETGRWRVHRLHDGWIDVDRFRRTNHTHAGHSR